jgi:predicted metalloprotease with PDZ domain
MIKSKFLLVAVVLLFAFDGLAQNIRYNYTIDLTNVVDDKVYVELEVDDFSGEELIFRLPKMIPGTYAIEDYGRFVSDFSALDKKGKSLPTEKIGVNAWTIGKTKKLRKITYWVEDSYDTMIEGPEIFQPAGTNIEAGKNFIINSSGFFGYFEGETANEYQLNVIKPANFYGSTGLIPVSMNNNLSGSIKLEGVEISEDALVDVFTTTNYDELVDSPLMYSLPDTTLLKVADTEVLVSVYSPNKVVTAEEIAATIEEVLVAQKEYLGGELPVDKYAFIFYFTDQPVMSYGALEHSYSSFYYMPEYPIEYMNQQLRDFAAHEFFHIVTPLNIHSEQIQPFNFTNPEMSRHLWLYEGMTEYFAGNAQVQAGLITIDEYINMLREKMFTASEFDDNLPFTELSLGALDLHADQYYNVYQKGALLGLALDLSLLELSEGSYGVQQMMADLAKEFGKDKSFQDDQLFEIITDLTYPEIRDFFTVFVEGDSALNLNYFFAKAGLIYEKQGVFYDYSFGLTDSNLSVDMERNVLYVENEEELDAFGKSLGYKNGDILVGFNGTKMPDLGPEVMQYLQEAMGSLQEGKEFSVTVIRANEEDVEEEITLTAPAVKVERIVPHTVRPMEETSDLQWVVRKAWLGLE